MAKQMYSFRLDDDIIRRLDKISNIDNCDRTKALEKAVIFYSKLL